MSDHEPMAESERHDEFSPRPTLADLEREWAAEDADWRAWELEAAERRGRRQALIDLVKRQEELLARWPF
jgi:hypothetical protein